MWEKEFALSNSTVGTCPAQEKKIHSRSYPTYVAFVSEFSRSFCGTLRILFPCPSIVLILKLGIRRRCGGRGGAGGYQIDIRAGLGK
jgi:hypothetical protein